jgi:hypothetical protein
MISFAVPFVLSEVIDLDEFRSKLWIDTDFDLIPLGHPGLIEFEISNGPLNTSVSGKLSLSIEEGAEETFLTSNFSLHFINGATVSLADILNPIEEDFMEEWDFEADAIRETWGSLPDKVQKSLEELETDLLDAGLDLLEQLLWDPEISLEHRFQLTPLPESAFEVTSLLLKWAHLNDLSSTGELSTYSQPIGSWWFTLKVDEESAWGIPAIRSHLAVAFDVEPQSVDSWLWFLSENCDLHLSVEQDSYRGLAIAIIANPEIRANSRENKLLTRFLLKILFEDDGQILRKLSHDFQSN